MIKRGIKIIQRLGNAQIGVGVEVTRKLVRLIAQVGFDLEFGIERVIHTPVFQRTAEFVRHLVIGKIGDVPNHARDTQAAPRLHAVCVVISTVKIRIGEYRLARHFVKGNILCRQVGGAGNDQRVPCARRVGDGPLHTLHGAQAAAHHRGKLFDAEVIGETRLRVHPVLHRDHRKTRPPRHAGVRIDRQRPGGAMTAAEIVHAHHKKPVGIQRLVRADHVVPPADVVRLVRIHARHVVRRVERMTDQHRVRARSVERAVGFVGQFVVGKGTTALERQRLVKRCPLRRHHAYACYAGFGSCWCRVHENKNLVKIARNP